MIECRYVKQQVRLREEGKMNFTELEQDLITFLQTNEIAQALWSALENMWDWDMDCQFGSLGDVDPVEVIFELMEDGEEDFPPALAAAWRNS